LEQATRSRGARPAEVWRVPAEVGVSDKSLVTTRSSSRVMVTRLALKPRIDLQEIEYWAERYNEKQY
jgi:hypothetical protein